MLCPHYAGGHAEFTIQIVALISMLLPFLKLRMHMDLFCSCCSLSKSFTVLCFDTGCLHKIVD